MRDLYFFYDDSGNFLDYSKDAREYLRDDFALDFVSSEDFIYMGLYKPYGNSYLELKTPTTLSNNLSAEYWNGTSFQSLELDDDTKGFQRSGFISWKKPEDWSESVVNGESKYWVRFSADDFTAEIQGWNLVFSDDNDLVKRVRLIHDELQGTDSSFIAYHVGARDEIIQTLRNAGNKTKKEQQEFYQNLSKWDLLDIGEIREASLLLTLALIYDDASENIDDKQYQRKRDFKSAYSKAFDLYMKSIDLNDDGKADTKTEVSRSAKPRAIKS